MNTASKKMDPIGKSIRVTLNHMGYEMDLTSDIYFKAFIEAATKSNGIIADLGCAFGRSTIQALEAGQATVIANDLCHDHLKELKSSLENRRPDLLERLITKPGNALKLDVPPSSLDAILAANWLHFLQPADVRRAFQLFHRWLKTEGKAFVITVSTHIQLKPEARKKLQEREAAGEEWPGMLTIEDFHVPLEVKPDCHPHVLAMNPETLEREAATAGLIIEKAGYCYREDFPLPEWATNDGKEFSGLICVKP